MGALGDDLVAVAIIVTIGNKSVQRDNTLACLNTFALNRDFDEAQLQRRQAIIRSYCRIPVQRHKTMTAKERESQYWDCFMLQFDKTINRANICYLFILSALLR